MDYQYLKSQVYAEKPTTISWLVLAFRFMINPIIWLVLSFRFMISPIIYIVDAFFLLPFCVG